MATNRFDDAPHLAFHEFLEARAHQPFCWGVNDCSTFAADGLLLLTGRDPMAKIRGRYTSGRGALKVTKEVFGTSDLLGAVTLAAAAAGLKKRLHPLTAMRCDLVLAEQQEGKLICGLVGLSGRWIHAPGERGLASLCLTQVRHAWTY